MMAQIESTIILTKSDLKNEDQDRKTVWDFKLTVEQINNADNIIYITPLGTLIMLKVKKMKEFRDENSWISKVTKNLVR